MLLHNKENLILLSKRINTLTTKINFNCRFKYLINYALLPYTCIVLPQRIKTTQDGIIDKESLQV